MTDRYEIKEHLKEDILGSVFLAEDNILQRSVMLRTIEFDKEPRDASWRKEFNQYAGKIGALQHPNTITIYDLSVQDEGVNVVSQFIDGETLAERMQQGPLGQTGVYKMASDMLEVIHAAHDAGLFHGALHMASIRRIHRASGGHRYLLIDLGLNQIASMVKAKKVQVEDPVLMAPELHKEGSQPDEKADLFMLGQLCYSAMVGGHPYAGKSAQESVEAYSEHGTPPILEYLPDIDPPFANWIMRMTEVDPAKRFADTAEAMVALHTITLSDPEPNVPGKTEAVYEQPAPTTANLHMPPVTQLLTTPPETHSIQASVAQPLPRQTQEGSEEGSGNGIQKKKKNLFIIGGGVAGLIIIALIALSSGGADKEKKSTTANLEKQKPHLKHAIRIKDPKIFATLPEGQSPKDIDLDGSTTLDWNIALEVPSSSKYIDKHNGRYILSCNLLNATKEQSFSKSPIRFKTKAQKILPSVVIHYDQGARIGSGYTIQLRIPPNRKNSITATLYIYREFCDLSVAVTNPKDDSITAKKFSYGKPGVLEVPIEIDGPSPGDFYTVEVTASAPSTSKKIVLGINAILVDER